MNDDEIKWKTISCEPVFKTWILSVQDKTCLSPENIERSFTTIKTQDWVMIIPEVEIDGEFYLLMVKQWRYGIDALSVEFPGGVIDPGETAEEAARRELTEETGYVASKLKYIASFSPNPALMENRQYVFTARCEQKPSKKLKLDPDEFINVQLVKRSDVVKKFGKPPYDHSLHCAGLFYYLKNCGLIKIDSL